MSRRNREKPFVNEFVRYGSLAPQEHVPWGGDGSNFHLAPVRLGFYAFPRGYVERFLLGGVGSGSAENGRWRYWRDEGGCKIVVRDDDFYDYDDYDYGAGAFGIREPYRSRLGRIGCGSRNVELKQVGAGRECFVMIENKPRRFSYGGPVWHHLDMFGEKRLLRPGDALGRSGSWTLSPARQYARLLSRFVHMMKFQALNAKIGGTEYPNVRERIDGYPSSRLCKDDLEVFIERL